MVSIYAARMHNSELFFVLAIVVFLIICITMRDPTEVIVWCSVAAGLLWYFRDHVNMRYEVGANESKTDDAAAAASPAPSDQNPNLRYGVSAREYDAYINSFSQSYAPVQPVSICATDVDNSMDSNMALIGQKRARDKRAIDGAVVKDANFYRHHFADELDRVEKRVWWGESEF